MKKAEILKQISDIMTCDAACCKDKKKQGHKGLPFRVCRFGDILYVTEVAKDSLLAVGDKIIEINGDSVKAFYEKYKGFFYGESLERTINTRNT